MDTKISCFDCGYEGRGCVSFRCNLCKVDVCTECISDHYALAIPHGGHKCLNCDYVADGWDICVENMRCPGCEKGLDFYVCPFCSPRHFVIEQYSTRCFKCRRIGCTDSVKSCGYEFCARNVCLSCGFRCEDSCDLVRCSFKHSIKCRECGCTPARCHICQSKYDDDGPICIDCNNGICPENSGQAPVNSKRIKMNRLRRKFLKK